MPGRAVGRCDTCKGEHPVWDLIKCQTCGHLSCHRCATFAYGRYFCSSRCAQYFFHSEPDEDEEKDKPDGA